jgi:hypothetical protein
VIVAFPPHWMYLLEVYCHKQQEPSHKNGVCVGEFGMKVRKAQPHTSASLMRLVP